MKPHNLMRELEAKNIIKAEEYINEKFVDIKPFKKNKDTTGIRSQQRKIELLEKGTFLLKLQLSYYKDARCIDASTKRVLDMQIQNDALTFEIHAKNVTIWKAFQLLKYFEAKPIFCVSKTSSQFINQHLQDYEFKNQMNNSDILESELNITLAINALLIEKNRGYEEFLLKARKENHRIATILRNMNRKYRHLKLDLMNIETERDMIMTQMKANEHLLRELEKISTTHIFTINELLYEAIDLKTSNGGCTGYINIVENCLSLINNFIQFMWQGFRI